MSHIDRQTKAEISDYEQKEALIQQLTDASDKDVMNCVLTKIGEALGDTPFSDGQCIKFLKVLDTSGVLTYQREYRDNQELAKVDKDFDENKPVLDCIRWDTEGNGKLQMACLVAATQLIQPQQTVKDRVSIITELFKTARGETITYSFGQPYPNEFQTGISLFESFEEYIYKHRVTQGSRLATLGLASDKQVKQLQGMSVEEFKNAGELHDQLIAMDFLNKFADTDTLGYFQKLQGVLQAGYSMGVRNSMADYYQTMDNTTNFINIIRKNS